MNRFFGDRCRLPGLPFVGILLLLASGVPDRGAAGPLHDPFLEQFQVGAWPRAADVDVVDGFPAGLLASVQLDTAWTNAAAKVLTPAAGLAHPTLTDKLLKSFYGADAETVWRHAAAVALQDLVAGRAGDSAEPFLWMARHTRAFSAAIESGDTAAAALIATTILSAAEANEMAARERMVWQLRLRLTSQMTGGFAAASDSLWPGFTELGPFDAVNGWALWAACRQQQGLPLVPTEGDRTQLAAVMEYLPVGAISASELYTAGLKADDQSALGAILLPANDLAAHFKKFPHPPAGFADQGRWVRGQRRFRKGLAGSYEQLATRRGLKPGWRMDVWRRASEIRLLKGAWVEGLADLKEALALAQQGSGTPALRRRLRQWTEQALVLALAEDDLRTARELRDLGLTHFRGAEGEAFAAEIAHWQHRLARRTTAVSTPGEDRVDQARFLITSGESPDLATNSESLQTRFLAANDQRLWRLWYQWGTALANPTRVTGDRRVRAAEYEGILARQAAVITAETAADSALVLVGVRLRDRPWAGRLLRMTVDADAGRLCDWRTSPQRSPVPDLLPKVRRSELDRHALLGFCLAIGDMRGILGLAFELPARGLTRAEKRLFLYPLPAVGAIRNAVASARSEPALLLAVARNESLFDPAVRSRAGALGWMQIMPFHFPAKGAAAGPDNWRVPAVSVQRGDGLLAENRTRYGGDPYRTVAAYNAGPTAAARWDRQLGGRAARDIYLAWIGYPETRDYVQKVLIDREIYNDIIGAALGAPGSGAAAGTVNQEE